MMRSDFVHPRNPTRHRPQASLRAVLTGSVALCCCVLTASYQVPVQAAVAPATAGATGSLGSIPSVEGHTLAGDAVSLPVDLAPAIGAPAAGRTAVLIIGFGREASGAARDWGQRLAADTASSPETVYFEMPVLAGVPRLLRGPILKLMAGSVSERGRHHFLPITEQEAAWQRAVDFRDANVPYILVVDDHGAVQWRTSGALSAPLYAQLREHLPAPSH